MAVAKTFDIVRSQQELQERNSPLAVYHHHKKMRRATRVERKETAQILHHHK